MPRSKKKSSGKSLILPEKIVINGNTWKVLGYDWKPRRIKRRISKQVDYDNIQVKCTRSRDGLEHMVGMESAWKIPMRLSHPTSYFVHWPNTPGERAQIIEE